MIDNRFRQTEMERAETRENKRLTIELGKQLQERARENDKDFREIEFQTWVTRSTKHIKTIYSLKGLIHNTRLGKIALSS